jgi:hypothetical protein
VHWSLKVLFQKKCMYHEIRVCLVVYDVDEMLIEVHKDRLYDNRPAGGRIQLAVMQVDSCCYQRLTGSVLQSLTLALMNRKSQLFCE